MFSKVKIKRPFVLFYFFFITDNPCESGDAVCGDNAFCLSDRSGGYTCICNNGYEHDLNYGCVGKIVWS